MAKYQILMTDSLFGDQEIEQSILRKIDAELVLAPKSDPATLSNLAKDCDAMLVTFAEVGKGVIDSCTRCKLIARMGIGVNNVDVEAATQKGIMVSNVLNYCITEVADHAMGLMLACLRKIVLYNKVVHEGVWNMNQGDISRLGTLTLGLYGFGNIARQVAKRAKAFDMHVIAYDPFLPDEPSSRREWNAPQTWMHF